MKVLVTGATGLIGQAVVEELARLGHEIVAVSRSANTEKLPSFAVHFALDIANPPRGNLFELFGAPDVVIHLAWDELRDFWSARHEQQAQTHAEFLKNLHANGAPRIVVAGTCLEYGMQAGELSEKLEPEPVVPYAVAKDKLRGEVESWDWRDQSYLWLRIFYLYSSRQPTNTLIGGLEAAIRENKGSFAMSQGDQIRDYLELTELARLLVKLAINDAAGVVNLCSGRPTTVVDLVRSYLAERGRELELKLGVYDYPAYEPMEFWGSTTKQREMLANLDSSQ